MKDGSDDPRLALSEHLRECAQRFVAVAPGEEEDAFDDAVVGLADVLELTVAARWDVARHGGRPSRRQRWVRPGADLDDPEVSTIDRNHPLAVVATTATEPVVLDDPEQLDDDGLLSESPLARRLTRLLVPGRSDDSVNCVLVLSRPMDRPWLDWETSMVADFAQLIPRVRSRVDLERRSSASFEAAPVGMVLRSEDHTVVEANEAFADLIGVDATDLVGRAWPELVDRERIDDDAWASVCDPPAGGQRRLEVPFLRSDGVTAWARVAEVRIASQHGDRWLSYLEDVTELRRRHEAAVRRASRDELTGLANRHQLFEVLGEHLAAPPDASGRATCAVVMIDLNEFKSINDVHGHVVGDAVLTAVGERLSDLTRASDLVARYGGDEFVVVLHGPIGALDAQRVASKLAAAVSRPVVHDGRELDVGAAVGVAVARRGEDAVSVVARADAEMYRDKSDGVARPSLAIGA